MEGLVVDGDGERGVILIVYTDNSAAQPHTTPSHAASHLLFAENIRMLNSRSKNSRAVNRKLF